jgi:hypothetical protein
LLALLIALVSGLVLAAAAAGRRTESAFPRYEAAHGYDAFLYSEKPLPRVAALPDVSSAALVRLPVSGTPTCACARPINLNEFSLFEVAPPRLTRIVKLVAGTMPDQSDPDQVLASFTLQQDHGVRIGTVLHVPLAAASQRDEVLRSANITPRGPTVALRVVGIEASEIEFPATNSPSYDLYTTQAFARKFNHRATVLDAYFLRLRHGAADLPRFQAAARTLGGLSVSDLDSQANAINFSIHPQAVGWWILAVLAGLVGITVVAQALGRQGLIEAGTFATLRALGISRRQLVVLNVTRTLGIGVAGVAVGVGLAFLVSPFAPVGEARLADSTGFAFDGLVLGLGAVGLVVLFVALGLWPAIRTARLAEAEQTDRVLHPSRIVAFLRGAGAPPSGLIGIRHALERGRGRTSVPVGSALLGAVLAVIALSATAIFGASLTHLTGTPALYGQPFDLSFAVNQTGSATQADEMLGRLQHAGAISAITVGVSGDVTINGKSVDAIAGRSLRGPLLVTSTDGRLPGVRYCHAHARPGGERGQAAT